MNLTLSDADAIALARLNLQQHAEQARYAFAANTERALKADVAIFMDWCRTTGCLPLPADPGSVARFIDTVGEERATATVRRYVSSIATFHCAAGMPNPVDTMMVKLALKRLHRAKGRVQAQAVPLNRPIVDRMLTAAPDTLIGWRNRALLAVAYDTLARRSELVALQLDDIEASPDGAASVLIRRSKADQEGIGEMRYLAPDTMRHLRIWLTAGNITSGSLFHRVTKGGHVEQALSSGAVAAIFKAMAAATGLSAEETARISGHSSRVGAAQDMAKHGLELPSIMQAGGWKTATMVARYTARLDTRRSGAAKLAMIQDRS